MRAGVSVVQGTLTSDFQLGERKMQVYLGMAGKLPQPAEH